MLFLNFLLIQFEIPHDLKQYDIYHQKFYYSNSHVLSENAESTI